MKIELLGSRVGGVNDLHAALAEQVRAGLSELTVVTAYFGPDTFAFLTFLESLGSFSLRLLLAANGSAAPAWRAAEAFAATHEDAVAVAAARHGTILHPKVFLAEAPTRQWAVIGSSNLSGGGLFGNVELNVAVEEAIPGATFTPSVRHVVDAWWDGALRPDAALWSALIDAAPAHSRSGKALGSKQAARMPSLPLLGEIPAVPPAGFGSLLTGILAGAGQRTAVEAAAAAATAPPATPVAPVDTAATTILIELTRSEVNRRPWTAAGGTASPTFRADVLQATGLVAGYYPVELVGQGKLAGTLVHATVHVQPRGRDGKPQKETRYVLNQDIKDFILADLDTGPAPFDVLVIEVPAGPMAGTSVLRCAVLDAATAAASGLTPTAHTRRSSLNGRRFKYEWRPGRLIP